MFANWTIDGVQHQFNKNWWIRQKRVLLTNTKNPKYQQKLKFIPSPEQNHFSGFAMRYPVILYGVEQKLSTWRRAFYWPRGLSFEPIRSDYLQARDLVESILFLSYETKSLHTSSENFHNIFVYIRAFLILTRDLAALLSSILTYVS